MTDSLSTIFAIVVHAPIWVWALYALLLILGLQRTRDRTVSIWRELILPVVVTPLAISNLIGVGLGGLPTTLVALAIGATVGWWLERDGNTRRLGMAGFGLRGEWSSFFQIALVLVFRLRHTASLRR